MGVDYPSARFLLNHKNGIRKKKILSMCETEHEIKNPAWGGALRYYNMTVTTDKKKKQEHTGALLRGAWKVRQVSSRTRDPSSDLLHRQDTAWGDNEAQATPSREESLQEL